MHVGARKDLEQRESVLEDSCMLTPLDPATLPRKVIALCVLLLQREAEYTAALEQQTAELERQVAELQAARTGLQEQVLRNEQLKLLGACATQALRCARGHPIAACT